MAVAHDATSLKADWAESVASWTHTPSGTPNYVEIAVGWMARSTTINAITYGGSAMTLVTTTDEGSSGSKVAIYGLVSPSSGAQTCSITFSTNVNYAARATTYTGVDTGTPRGTEQTTTGFGTAPSLSVTSAAGELVSDAICVANRTYTLTVGADQTERANHTSGGGTPGVLVGGSTEAGGTSVTMSWTIGTSGDYSYVASPIKASGGGGGGTNLIRGVKTFDGGMQNLTGGMS